MTPPKSSEKPQFIHLTGWPIYRWNGELFTFDLWRKDLELHFLYISKMSLYSPVVNAPPPSNATQISKEIVDRIDLVKVPNITTKTQFLLGIIPFLWKLIRGLRNAEVIQCILVEQPVFYGLFIPLLKLFTKIPTIVFVESSAWRKKHFGGKFDGILRFREMMARSAVRNATVSFHTQGEYQRSLHGQPETSLVVPAVWMNEEDVLSEQELQEIFAGRSQTKTLNLGYFGGLIYDKGLDILILSIMQCIQSGLDVYLSVFGEGAMKEEFMKLAQPAGDRIQFCGMLPYGPIFRKRLAQCDAVVIPSRTNEHLRINVDSMSQGVPVIGSDVPGLSQFIRNGENGLLVLKESPNDLTRAIREMQSLEMRRKMAFTARKTVEGLSHKKMHQTKAYHIIKYIPNLTTINPPTPDSKLS